MKNVIISLIILVCLSTFTNLTIAQSKKEFKIPYEKYLLANGLNVILHIDRSDPIVSVYVRYKVGSNREKKGKTGFAHLFEHLMFNESQNVPQREFFRKIQAAGGSLNAATNKDGTWYYETVPKNVLEMVLWMESDRMGFLLPTVNEKTFVTQQNVVLNEKRQNDNRAYSGTQYVLDKLLYPDNHPYNWQTLGEYEDIANATIKDAVDFYNEYYQPSNATLVVAGDIDVEQTKKWIEKYFGEIKSTPKPINLQKNPVILTEIKKFYYEDNLSKAPKFSIVFPTVEEYSPDSYALNYLGGVLQPYISKVIVEEKKLSSNVWGIPSFKELAGNYMFEITAFPDKNLGEFEMAVQEAFARFEKEGFTDIDIEADKARNEFYFYTSLQSTSKKAQLLGEFNASAGSPDFLYTDMNRRFNVTRDDIWRVYNNYFKGKPYIIVSTVPKGKANLAVPGSRYISISQENIDKQGVKKSLAPVNILPIQSKFDRSVEPQKGPDPLVASPQIWTDKFDNGIKFYGINQNEVPLVQFIIYLKGGMLLDPADKLGTSYLLARLLNEGTKNKTRDELHTAVSILGADIRINSGLDFITILGNCMASKLADVMKIAREMMFEPRWDEKEFASIKQTIIQQLLKTGSAPASIADNAFNKLVYGPESPLAQSFMGTAESIERITLDDLKDYYNNYFVSNRASITIIGDMTKEEALSVFNPLKDWKSKDFNVDVKNYETAKPGIYFIDVPNAKQSELRVGHLSIKAIDPDYFGATVMNHKLGGDFNGTLNLILREEKGYTYSAKSSFNGSASLGSFNISTSVQSNSTFEAAQIIKDEIENYLSGISAEDLETVKSTLLKGYIKKFETFMNLYNMLCYIVYYNYPFDYIAQQQEFIRKITLKEHKKLAQKYIQPDKMIYLIVGDKTTQFDKLKKLGLGDPILIDRDGNPVKD